MMKIGIIISFLSATLLISQLETRKILDDKVQILMPTDFKVMSEDLLSRKYPSNNRPTLVYTDETGMINLAINHTVNKITIEQLPEALPVFVNQFQNLYPTIQWYQKEMIVLNGRKFAMMEFITPAADSDIYNLMFITELEGRLLMFSFNCTKQLEGEWKPMAHKMMNSVTIQ